MSHSCGRYTGAQSRKLSDVFLLSDEYTVAIRRRRLVEEGSWQFTKAGVNLPTASLRHLLQLFLRGGEYDLLPLSAHKHESTVSSAFFG